MRGKSSTFQYYTIEQREEQKIKKYQDRCRQMNSDFVPLAFEVYGACSGKFELFYNKQVVQKAAVANDIRYPTPLSYWRRQKSTALQISNADILTKAYIYLFMIYIDETLN